MQRNHGHSIVFPCGMIVTMHRGSPLKKKTAVTHRMHIMPRMSSFSLDSRGSQSNSEFAVASVSFWPQLRAGQG